MIETWRRSITLALQKALVLSCHQYSGVKKEQIEALLKCDDVLQAYYVLTQTSQKVANETKADYFLESTKLVGTVGRNVVCHEMDGMEVTPRTAAWRKSLALLVPWWSRDDKYLEECITSCRRTLSFGFQDDGRVCEAWKYSHKPTEAGTYIHKAFGDSISAQCAKMFGWDELINIIPGRMIHAGLPWIGVTPDAIAVVDDRALHEVSRRLFAGETIPAVERGAGAPWMTLELKTIHGRASNNDDEEDATIHEHEIDRLYGTYEHDEEDATKEAALKFFVKKLELAGWIPENLYVDDSDYRLEKDIIKLRKSQNTKTRKSCEFFKKSTILYPTGQFKKLRVEEVGGEVYPNLARLSASTLRVTDEPPKKKSRAWSQIVPLKEMVIPGKACMIVYKIGKKATNEILFRLDWAEAPLMLTLNSDHFNQVMGQHATARQVNEDVKSLFAVALRSHRSRSAPFGKDPIQLAIVYAYDVGIQAAAVDAFSDVLSREIALATQGMNNSESVHAMLFSETSLESRREALYRRASVMEKLADPSDSEVIERYRHAFDGGALSDEDEDWSADDVAL